MKTLAALLLLATPALADETWITPEGPAIYVNDIDYTAILSLPYGGKLVHLYFDGMAGNFSERYMFSGYWIGEKATEAEYACSAALTGPDGRSS